jgi:hypothetical protein
MSKFGFKIPALLNLKWKIESSIKVCHLLHPTVENHLWSGSQYIWNSIQLQAYLGEHRDENSNLRFKDLLMGWKVIKAGESSYVLSWWPYSLNWDKIVILRLCPKISASILSKKNYFFNFLIIDYPRVEDNLSMYSQKVKIQI